MGMHVDFRTHLQSTARVKDKYVFQHALQSGHSGSGLVIHSVHFLIPVVEGYR